MRRPPPPSLIEAADVVEDEATSVGKDSSRKKAKKPPNPKAISYFPTRNSNSNPVVKVSILQRLLASLPFRRLALSVQLFSLDAETWWTTCPATGPVGRPKKPAATSKEPSATAHGLAETPKKGKGRSKAATKTAEVQTAQAELVMAYPPAEKPNLDHVTKILRPHGVDGQRLIREGVSESTGGKVETLSRIEVDDSES